MLHLKTNKITYNAEKPLSLLAFQGQDYTGESMTEDWQHYLIQQNYLQVEEDFILSRSLLNISCLFLSSHWKRLHKIMSLNIFLIHVWSISKCTLSLSLHHQALFYLHPTFFHQYYMIIFKLPSSQTYFSAL